MVEVVLLGTCDTKLEELLFLRRKILEGRVDVTLIDVGRNDVEDENIGITRKQLIEKYGDKKDAVDFPRGELIQFMAECATKAVKELYDEGAIHGIIAAGGSGGTSLASAVMRDALPVGFPKLIVSTVASGDTGPIIGETDIMLMYSVVDIAGLNEVLCDVLSNTAAATSQMAKSYFERKIREKSRDKKKKVGITMFGVTTPAVDTIRRHLESNYDIECYVFHATGHGGKAMERLIHEGRLDAVLDLTTTEICDHLTGGNMSAGPNRLDAAAKAGIPNIISVGATDMSNFGPKSTVPERYHDRLLYEHNPVVTLMRTSVDEAKAVGEFIVNKLKKHAKQEEMVEVWLPKGGVSIISTPGGPFADHEADKEMFQVVRDGLSETSIPVVEDDRAINDTSYATDIADAFVRKLGLSAK